MRLIDVDAYSAEMRNRQDAAVEWRKEAAARCEADEEALAYQALATFCEAKLTLDKMPTIDAVPVVRCGECKFFKQFLDRPDGTCSNSVINTLPFADDYCKWGILKARKEKDANETD